MLKMSRFAALIAVLSFAVACGSDSSTSPSTSVAGNWSGQITNSVVGNGTLTMTLLQSGNSLSGTWATTFTNASNNNSGSLSGTVSGTQVAAVLSPSVPTSCSTNVAGAISGTTISGTYAAVNCSVAQSGTFTITQH